ncbi:MAG: MMPL family transporter [Desulfobacteraceae bacterium]|nr:MMPL family transporter [Desulfobacteraceae bacterium]
MLIDLYDRLILKRPLATLLAMAIVTGIFACAMHRFKLDASADSLVLENDRALRYHWKTSAHYGSQDYLIITYTPHGDLFSEKSLARLKSIRDELNRLEGVDSVTTILDAPLLFSPLVSFGGMQDGLRTLETPGVDLSLARREFQENPIYSGRLVSSDDSTTAILVNLPLDRENQELLLKRTELREKKYNGQLTPKEATELKAVSEAYRQRSTELMVQQRRDVAAIREIMDRHRDHGTLFLGGVPMIASDMVSYIRNDLMVFGSGVLLFIIITMWVIFRSARWVILPLFCCFAAIVTMMGFLGMMDWRVTVISSNFISLMIIITISMTVHLVVRYRELCGNDRKAGQRTLIREAVRLKAIPCLYTTLTTIAAFGSLTISSIRPVMDFGMMMSLGLFASYLISFILLPAGAMLLNRENPAPAGSSPPLTLRFAAFTEAHGMKILWISILLGLLSAMGISKLIVENRFIDYFKESTEIYQGLATIDRELGGTTPLDLIIDFKKEEPDLTSYDDEEEDDLLGIEEDKDSPKYWFKSYRLERLEEVHDYLAELPETGNVLSIVTLMKVITRLNGGVPLDDYELAILYDKIPGEIKDMLISPYVSVPRNQVRIAMRVRESDKSLAREELLRKIRSFLTERMGFQPEQVNLTNMLVLYNNMLQSLFRSQIMTLGLVFFGIMIMFLVLFRSLYIAVIAIIPNLLPAAMVLGTMGWLGIPLDMMTITIAAITIGIGVDNTIHYIHRFRKEFKQDRDYMATLYRCHGSIGRAMFYTSLTIIAGFSILTASNFIPTIYFGLFTGFGMLTALLAALTLLPQLLVTLKPLGPGNPLTAHGNV